MILGCSLTKRLTNWTYYVVTQLTKYILEL